MSHLWDKDLAIACGAITGSTYAKDTFSSSLVFPLHPDIHLPSQLSLIATS